MTKIWAWCDRNHSLNTRRRKRYFSSPKHPDQPWGLTSLLFRKHLAFSPRVKAATACSLPLIHM